MSEVPERFPKCASPYFRSEDENGNYTIDPYSVKPKFQWVFEKAAEVEAIEKLDGTNCAVAMDGSQPVEVYTRMGDKRMQLAHPFGNTNEQYIVRAVQNSLRRGYLDDLGTGSHFGEVVGPKLQGNPHELDERLFIPFEWLRDKCSYKSYGKYDTSYDAIRDWFRGEENGLFSLFASRMHGQDLEASRPSNGTFVEGLIFVHPDFDGQIHPDDLTVGNVDESGRGKVKELAKVRRDMFSPYYDDWPLNGRSH